MRSHKTRGTRDRSIPRSLQRRVSMKSSISQLTSFLKKYISLSRVRKSADIRILTTEDKICPYVLLCWGCQRCLLFFFSCRVVRLSLVCMFVVVSYIPIFLSAYHIMNILPSVWLLLFVNITFLPFSVLINIIAFFVFLTPSESMRAVMTLLHCDRIFHVQYLRGDLHNHVKARAMVDKEI